MAVRLAWAVGSAIVLAVWLWRSVARPPADGASTARPDAALRAAALTLCGFWAAVWVVIALLRLRYPYELEWAGGAMHDMAMRALHGQPLYVAPGPGWFPFEYPPLYAWVCAAAMRLLGTTSYVPMRLVSILSTLGSAALLFIWVRRTADCGLRIADCKGPNRETGRQGDEETGGASGNRKSKIENRKSIVWPVLAAGLFLAAYRFTGAWYDIERIDMLFLFLSLLGAYWTQVASERRSVGWTCMAGVAFGLAFLTKQQAALFLVAGVGALLWLRQWRLAVVLAVVGGVLCVACVLALDAATRGWFRFYCFIVPRGNGVQAHLALAFVRTDLPLFAPVIATIAVAGVAARRARDGKPGRYAVLVAMTVAGVVGSGLSRAHWGGYENVLITSYVTLGALACALAARLARRRPAARAPLLALALAQLLALTYRPGAQLPTAEGRASGDRYAALVRDLERGGEVLCLDHGGFTQPPHFHILGLMDVYRAQKQVPPALVTALRTHRYAAVVSDAEPSAEGDLGEFRRDYPRIECVNIAQPWVVTGFASPGPDRRVWVMRPPANMAVNERK